MTPQEQQMIDGLIDRIRNTQLTDRDPVAASHLQQGLGNNPDAIYILAQTVLVQQQAMLQAQQQLQSANNELAQLRQSAGQPAQPQSGSWLDRFFGTGSSPQQPNYSGPPSYPQQGYEPQQQQGYPPQQNYPAQQNYPPQQQAPYGTPVYGGQAQQAYPAPGYPQQPYPYPSQAYPQPGPGYGQPGYAQPSAGGSFLRTAATTAAGVAAGALIFEGVESMFGGHHGGGGGTTNNYYENDQQPEHHISSDSDGSFFNPSSDASGHGMGADIQASEHQGLSPDIEDRRGFADIGDDGAFNASDDSNAFDDNSSFDDSDSSSSDDDA